jgi:hypothetical protein
VYSTGTFGKICHILNVTNAPLKCQTHLESAKCTWKVPKAVDQRRIKGGRSKEPLIQFKFVSLDRPLIDKGVLSIRHAPYFFKKIHQEIHLFLRAFLKWSG